jgi:predicted GNAT family acetyltransferase
MQYRAFDNADDFLNITAGFLTSDEAVNGLMLGTAEKLKKNSMVYGTVPYFAAIEDDSGLVLIALMTPPYRLQLLSTSAACPLAAVSALAEHLHRAIQPVSGVLAREEIASAFSAAWAGFAGVGWQPGRRDRIHELRQVNPIDRPPGRFDMATVADLDLAIVWCRAFHAEAIGRSAAEPDISESMARNSIALGGLYFWRNVAGTPVSMAARVRPSARGESISWVYTPPAERRRGFASAVVADLAALILAEGREFCALYTDLANPTSNKIYRRIGFLPRADVVEIDFITA